MANVRFQLTSNGVVFDLTLTFAGAATSGAVIAISGAVGAETVTGLSNYVGGDNQIAAVFPFVNTDGLSFTTTAASYNIYQNAGAPIIYSPDHGFTNSLTSNVTYAPANSPPVLDHNFGLTVTEGGAGTISMARLEFNDNEQGDNAITYTVTSAATNGTLLLNGNALGVNGAFTQDDLNNNRVTYSHNGGETTSASFGFSVSDGTATVTGQTFNFTVTPVNDPPAVQNPPPAIITVTEDVLADIELGNFNFGDPDSGSGSLTLTFAASAGALSANSSGGVIVGGSGTGTITLTGTSVNLNAFIGTGLNDVSYQTAANASGNNIATLTYSITDNGNTGAGGANLVQLGTSQINATAVNDDPTAIALANASIAENSANGSAVGTLTTTDADSAAFTYTLVNSAGGRFAIGGAGHDQIVVADGALLDYETARSHSVRVHVEDGAGGAYERDFLIALTNVAGIAQVGGSAGETLTGTGEEDNLNGAGGADTINGLGGKDVLYGGAGVDTLNGGDGDDVLNGGAGADILVGGKGNDTYRVDGFDTVSEASGSGIDIVDSFVVSLDLADYANIENITLRGALALSATGNGAANTIIGNSAGNVISGGGGNDKLYGFDGDDVIIGGAGRDLLTGGAGADRFVFANLGDSDGATPDRIVDFTNGDLIDVRGIDADGDASNGVTAFILDGLSGVGYAATGHIHQTKLGNNLILDFNVDADDVSELRIVLANHASALTINDLAV